MTATESRRIFLNVAIALGKAEDDCESDDYARLAELLKWHLDQDFDVLVRHYPEPYKDLNKGSYCFWCSEDSVNPIFVAWPCPEIRGVAKALGIEDKL